MATLDALILHGAGTITGAVAKDGITISIQVPQNADLSGTTPIPFGGQDVLIGTEEVRIVSVLSSITHGSNYDYHLKVAPLKQAHAKGESATFRPYVERINVPDAVVLEKGQSLRVKWADYWKVHGTTRVSFSGAGPTNSVYTSAFFHNEYADVKATGVGTSYLTLYLSAVLVSGYRASDNLDLSIGVTEVNQPPILSHTFAPLIFVPGRITVISVTPKNHFSDPNGHPLTFGLTGVTRTVIRHLRVTGPDGDGTYTVQWRGGSSTGVSGVLKWYARDDSGLSVIAEQQYQTIVNNAPVVVKELPTFVEVLNAGSHSVWLASDYIIDGGDGDALTYQLEIADPAIGYAVAGDGTELATVDERIVDNFRYDLPADGRWQLRGLIAGATKITLYGKDSYTTIPTAASTFNVSSEPIWKPIPDQLIDYGGVKIVNLDDYASDPDGDTLTYSVVGVDPSTSGFPTNEVKTKFLGSELLLQGNTTTASNRWVTLEVGAEDPVGLQQTTNIRARVGASQRAAVGRPIWSRKKVYDLFERIGENIVWISPTNPYSALWTSTNFIEYDPIKGVVITPGNAPDAQTYWFSDQAVATTVYVSDIALKERLREESYDALFTLTNVLDIVGIKGEFFWVRSAFPEMDSNQRIQWRIILGQIVKELPRKLFEVETYYDPAGPFPDNLDPTLDKGPAFVTTWEGNRWDLERTFNIRLQVFEDRDYDFLKRFIGAGNLEVDVRTGEVILNRLYRLLDKGWLQKFDETRNLWIFLASLLPPNEIKNIKGVAGLMTITLTWDDPMDISVTHYEYTIRNLDDATSSPGLPQKIDSDATTTSYVITGLLEKTNYLISVFAYNSGGRARSEPVNIQTLSSQVQAPPVPAKPENLRVKAEDKQVVLDWDGSTDTTIVDYEYRIYREDVRQTPWTKMPGSTWHTDQYTFTGLDNGVDYYFLLRAVNAGGNSKSSTSPTVRPQGVVPAKPTGLVLLDGDMQTTVTWDDPQDATITHYEYKRGGSSPGQFQDWTTIPGSDATTTMFILTGLTNDLVYSLAIRAINAGGIGPSSDVVNPQPEVIPAPVAPTALTVEVRNGQLVFNWRDPQNPTILRYEYQYGVAFQSLSSWTTIKDSGPTTTRFILTGLTNDTRYEFRLLAINGSGRSPESFVFGTPKGPTLQEATLTGASFVAGLWSDGNHLYVVNESGSAPIAEVSKRNFDGSEVSKTRIGSGIEYRGLWSDGSHAWMARKNVSGVKGYVFPSFARDSSKDIAATVALGYASDGVTAYVMGSSKFFAYKQDGTGRDATKEFAYHHANTDPRRCTTDGTTMWVSDEKNRRIFAYSLFSKQRDMSKEVAVPTRVTGDVNALWHFGGRLLVASTGSPPKLWILDLP